MLLAVVGLSVAAAYSRPRIFFAPEHAGHGANGPERPQRLDDVCVPAVRGLGGAVEWTTVETPRADAEQAVRRVHDGAYVDMVKRRARSSLFGRQLLGPETFASFGSHAALLRAQSAWLEAVDSVLPVDAPGGRRVAWALTRPPGHHAGYSTAQGFCVYNFAAAACEHALEAGVDWCVVLDWDVHHGNGVADYVDAAALRGETRACYASTHEAALWPFTGDDAQDRGPRGNRFAAPVKRGAMLADYAEAWRACLDFAKAHVDKVGGTRGLVLVSVRIRAASILLAKAVGPCSCRASRLQAGFDALRTDSLAGCRLEPRDFAHLARDLATAFPDAPIVFGLEGGYSDDAGAALVAALEPFLGGDGALAADERVDERGDRGDGLVRLCDVPATDGFHRVSLPSRGSVVVCRDGDDFDVLPSRLPPFSLATHAYADFDRHLRCVVERSTRTKFYVESGAVRGTWSPALALTAGGGDAPSTRDGIKRLATRAALLDSPPQTTLVTAKAVCRPDGIFVSEAALAAVARQSAQLSIRRPTFLNGRASALSRLQRKLVVPPTRQAFERFARDEAIELVVARSPKELRVCARLVATREELGYYLVRTPREARTPQTDALIDALFEDSALANAAPGRSALAQLLRRGSAETTSVAAGVAVFVEPAARGRKLGEVLFKSAMRACFDAGYRYMLFVERDTGSGKLVQWYESMGFVCIPTDFGLDRAMIGPLPDPAEDPNFYRCNSKGVDLRQPVL